MHCSRPLRQLLLVFACAAAVVLLAVLGLASVAAQGPDLKIRSATLNLWPEYDDPGLLVIFSGVFSDTAAFPRPIAIPVPASARDIQATVKDASGRLLNQPWEVAGNVLSYTLPSPAFHVEYYVDRPPSGEQREVKYTFEASYPIQSLQIIAQQPARATDFAMTPAPGRSFAENSLTHYVLDRTDLAAGDKVEITLRYDKADPALSAPQMDVPAAAQPAEPAMQPTRRTIGDWLPWVLIGLGGTSLVGALVYWLLHQRREPSQRLPARNDAAPAPSRPAPGGTGFCTRCGNALRPGDRFCAQCGAPRKS